MPAPAAVDIITQLGVETTAGTAASANRKIHSLSVTPTPQIETEQFTPQGYKTPTVSAVQRSFSQGGYDGVLDFNTIVYILASLVGHSGTPSTPAGGTLSRQWDFAPNTSGADSLVKTYTVQRAPLATAAQQFTYVKMISMALAAAQGSPRVSGDVLARFPTEGVTLTSTPTDIAARPVTRGMINVYTDSTYGGIGGTKITDVYQESLNVGAKDEPFWVHNTDYPGFKELVEQAHNLTFSFRTAHNAQSRAQFDLIATNPTRYMRWEATGALIEGAIYELVRFDFAGKFTQAQPMYSDGAVYGYEYTFTGIHDGTFGRAWSARVINQLTGL